MFSLFLQKGEEEMLNLAPKTYVVVMVVTYKFFNKSFSVSGANTVVRLDNNIRLVTTISFQMLSSSFFII
jgi:hypothetical protein